jgi:hypothetical protein
MKKFGFLAYTSFMLLSWQFCGCGEQTPPSAAKDKSDQHEDHATEHGNEQAGAHSHGAGPHDGTLTDWGGGAFHVEFTVDHTKKEATVYILGSDEKSPAPIKAEKITLTLEDPASEIELVAKPLEGEMDGMSSRFVGVHDNLGIVKEFAGTISGEVEGVPYVGDFKETAHQH